MLEFCRQETHIARKVHKCSLCNDLISDFCKDNETNEFYTYDVEEYYKDKNCYKCNNEKTCTMSTKQCLSMLNKESVGIL